MSGFRLSKLNDILKKDTFVKMRDFVIECCELMNNESIINKEFLPNHEDKIKNRLVFEYLKSYAVRGKLGYSDIKLSFDAEVSQNYNRGTDNTNARLDIKVTSEDTLTFHEKYYTIECKRLDGYSHLNKEYVNQGISRFVSIDAKYASGYGKNLMLGFIVRDIDIKKNVEKIDNIQNQKLSNSIEKGMTFVEEKPDAYCIYKAEYLSPFGEVELQHLFYNLSLAIND
ncbi:MAG: hypothetical protein ACTIDE_08165 [Carnobacterium maltaromaticum]